MACEICSFVAKENESTPGFIIETSRWKVVLDSNQQFLGKAFIELKQHKQMLSDLDEGDWNELHDIVTKMEKAVKRAFSPTHFNWSCLMNNSAAAGEETHVHWHFHPRYNVAVEFGDEKFEDKTDHNTSKNLLNRIAKKIHTKLL